ncbi:MAG: methylmalonyl Co-A mutase-associated GTPase MeaB [Bacteroidia bacterium]|nr:MAG: methylmalonyl Co-A mutase-associated GTPase MeaB [Bacteroidia bacterium]
MGNNPAGNDRDKPSALKVSKGIPQPSSVNEQAANSFRLRKRQLLPAGEYVKGILAGDRVMLSRAITLIESALSDHYSLAQQVIEQCLPHSGKSLRVGITGVPGVGKSTFIEALGRYVISEGHRIAVLAVDPSSAISKGSILGDKTRMETLSVSDHAFVRPSPSAGSLGGVARKTKEIIILCEAAGYDIIFVETVGVGQSEVAVHSMVDFFLLLMLAGAGDELQGIKRGIIEMCDGMAINKADGDNIEKAKAARSQYENALHLFPPPPTGWTPKVITCSAITKNGIEAVWDMIREHEEAMKEKGHFQQKRNRQQTHRLHETIHEALSQHFYNNPVISKKLKEIEQLVADHKFSAYQAASHLLDSYFSQLTQNNKR